MVARLLLIAAVAAPLYAQDDDITRYIQELRAPKALHDVQAEQREQLTELRQSLDAATGAAQKAALYIQISASEQVLGNSDAAIVAARTAHDLSPADRNASLTLATLLLRNGQTAEVAALLGIDSSDGAALLREAQSLGSGPLAEYFAESAHRLLPSDPKTADTLGMIYLRSLHAREAQSAFREARELAPEVATYHYHSGLALVQSGPADEARTELVRALLLNPTQSERDSIDNTLARMSIKIEPLPVRQ